jgi:hypothetical protein
MKEVNRFRELKKPDTQHPFTRNIGKQSGETTAKHTRDDVKVFSHITVRIPAGITQVK